MQNERQEMQWKLCVLFPSYKSTTGETSNSISLQYCLEPEFNAALAVLNLFEGFSYCLMLTIYSPRY